MKKQKQKPVKCPYCGHAAVLKPKSALKEDYTGSDMVYVCSRYPECDAYVGVFPGTNKPMGILADRALRAKRVETHRALDRIWKSGCMSRKDTYRWLRKSLGMKESQAHIAKFSDYMCDQVLLLCKKFLQANHISEGG